MEEDWQRLADHVVTERVRRGLDLRSLAAETKVSERTLGKLESGQRVSRDTLAAIELAFDWPPGTCRGILLGGQSPAAPEQTQPPAKRNGDYPDWVAATASCSTSTTTTTQPATRRRSLLRSWSPHEPS
ncbi:helix-turn-helix domain-containing protein [Actinomadura madurae]|uniref:helix-turn-helix domain-containing protein n=1 Tax=Actinomadura madurae TaxID=1993 RepID=UPI0020D21E0C|nr:helix-turn-helix transcriptional regulator [Actinomadura madurae]MCP9976414.1 helix-turn-helix transcriptional regulator [Actinomadura madurae]